MAVLESAYGEIVSSRPKIKWEMLDIRLVPEKHKKISVRLNALGSLFYFSKAIIGFADMSEVLHYYMCSTMERDIIKQVQEWPRGHLKTSCFSIATPMWWALPFTEDDERVMRGLGYGDEWIRWMHRAHDQNTSTLILSETDTNAQSIGKGISLQYANNAVFKHYFPEIMPDRSSTWNMSSMMHKRNGGMDREGTYELAGVGSALQSRHYPRIIEDDLWGQDALYSPSEAEKTIEFHKKIPGLFRPDAERPGHMGDNLVVGNRWAVNDLNGWIRKNQTSYAFETHAVDGGCCAMHPKGKLIFPRMFNEQKLAELRETYGPTGYAAQMLNNPLDESNRRFQDEWLQHYAYATAEHPLGALNEDGSPKKVTRFKHEIVCGRVLQDVYPSQLHRFIILDPCHSDDDKRGRSRHAILTLGYLPGKTPRLYILDAWAERCAYEKVIDTCFSRAAKWRVDTVWCEVLAGQDGWLLALKERNRALGNGLKHPLKIEPLKKDRSPDAKRRRIGGLEPLFSQQMIYACRQDRGYTQFRTEYDAYESNQTIDLLDCLGYFPQCVENVATGDPDALRDFMRRREALITGSMGAAGY